MYLGFQPLYFFVMKQSRSHPGSKVPFNRGNIQDLVLLTQDQLLRDVEQRLERIKVGVPVGAQVYHCNFLQVVPLLSSLWT